MTDDERFDAFGMTVYHGGQSPTTTPYGFMGKKGYQTDTSGLMLLGHRYYDAGIGRFLSRDPIHDGSNWYAYCGNNPLDKTDPTGMLAQLSSGFGQDMFAQSGDDEDSDWSLYKYMYTGDGHASNNVYNAALEQGASGLNLWANNMASANKDAAGAVLSAGLGVSLTASKKSASEMRDGASEQSSKFRRLGVKASDKFKTTSKISRMIRQDNRIFKRGFRAGGMARAGALARFGILGVATFEAGASVYSAARATQNQPLITATGE